MNEQKLHKLYMDIAVLASNQSCCKKKKVGAVIVDDDGATFLGWNMTPSGALDECEVEVDDDYGCYEGTIMVREPLDPHGGIITIPVVFKQKTKTHFSVIHAEEVALGLMTRNGYPAKDAKVYSTISPCVECTKMLHNAGIMEVYYKDRYKSLDHLGFYEELGMSFYQLGESGAYV